MPKLEIMPNQTGQLGTGSQTGAEFKADLKSGKVKFGIFVNSASPTVAEQLSFSGYDCAPPLPAPRIRPPSPRTLLFLNLRGSRARGVSTQGSSSTPSTARWTR